MNRNQYMQRALTRTSNAHGKESEKRVAKKLAIRLQPNSGALVSAKGDAKGEHGRYKTLVECKSTVHDSLSIERGWLSKINKEALAVACSPMVVVSFVTLEGKTRDNVSDWVMVPRAFMEELLHEVSTVDS